MKTMLTRNGLCAAIEQVLTLPIRGAPYTIDAAQGDKGEAEFVNSVMMSPDEDGGMKTPITDLVGQVTSAQIFKRAFFERTYKIRETDGKIIYDAVAYRPPATCQARYNDRTGEPNGFRQQVWMFGGNLMISRKQKVPGYVDIPKIRSYIYTHGKHREPLTGVSEMDTAYWNVAFGTNVQTPLGPVKIEDIQRGDLIFASNGNVTPVLDVILCGEDQMYRFTFKNGETVEAGIGHLWGVYDTSPGGRKHYRVMSTREILDAGLKRSSGWRFGVPRCEAVGYPERSLPLDPYVLGAWLGDGRIGRLRARFCSFEPDDFIVDEIRHRLPDGMKLATEGTEHGWYEFRPVVRRGANPVRDALETLGVRVTSTERFIPEIYLRASVKQRWDLLRGLMDTDGSARSSSAGRTSGRGAPTVLPGYSTKSRRLAEDVRTLARSLGGNAVITENSATGKLDVAVDVDECPFLLPRKVSYWMDGQASLARRKFRENKIVSIERTTVQESRCITVGAEDGLFLTNDYIITHNCYQTQAKLLYLWLNFLEGQAMQRLVVYGNDQPEATARADDIAQLRGSGVVGLIHPVEGQKTFEAIPTDTNAGDLFAGMMTFLENWMVSSVNAGFLQLTGAAAKGRAAGGSASGGGSYGMSESQSSYYLASRKAVATEIADSISHDLIRPLVVLNFGTDAAFPKWNFGPLQESETGALFTMFGTMAAAPALNVPLTFIDLLTERMAVILDLDEDQIHQALVSTASQRAEKLAGNPPPGMPPEAAAGLGQLQGIAAAGTGIAQAAAARGSGQPSPAPPTPQAIKAALAPLSPAGPPTPPPGKPPMAGGPPAQ
jgi:LAGLIDADG-like domain